MKRKVVLGLGITTAILILAAAAYLAVNWMTPGSAGINLLGLSLPGTGGNPVDIRILVTPAPGKPITQPDIGGNLVKIQDKSLIVQPIMKGDRDPVESGPQIEVVTTNETRLYRDATFDNVTQSQIESTHSVQEILNPMTMDQILVEGTLVMAWGERRGDRLIATVIILQQEVNKKGK